MSGGQLTESKASPVSRLTNGSAGPPLSPARRSPTRAVRSSPDTTATFTPSAANSRIAAAQACGSRPPALLTVELEPPMIASLRADLSRISVVATVQRMPLLAFAVAWARSARKLDAVERRAEREQRLVALGGMSSVMAHELRNPLASLKGHAQLLVEDLENDKHRKKAERIVAEA